MTAIRAVYTIGIIFLLLFAFNLMRVGVIFKYSPDGVLLRLRLGFVKLKLYPRRVKKSRAAKPEKIKKEKPEAEKKKGKKSFDPSFLKNMIAPAMDAAKRLASWLTANKLDIRIVAGGEDAAKTAVKYGNLCTAAGIISPYLENNRRVRAYYLRVDFDFTANKSSVYADVDIYFKIWHFTYILFSLGGKLIKELIKTRRRAKFENKFSKV
ncbi:MAG: DUF2953 domain-containing protein [Oscillospiraceae bacterium]|nr:DUF2953 domain-containing protein [Oscillospiraceae bacterium]